MEQGTAKKWFGDNWVGYIQGISNKELEDAQISLYDYLPKEAWEGKTVIDVGCGSGIFSFSALKSGAGKTISFDVDPRSIEAARLTREKYGKEFSKNWDIKWGSILDDEFVSKFKSSGDVVYAWGSLHHTGDMEKALENASKLVSNNGFFIIAIYNHAPSSHQWVKIKRNFASLPDFAKTAVEIPYAIAMTLGYMIKRRTLNIKKERGMDIYHDAIDWIRGHPYEFSCVTEMVEKIESKGFRLVKIPTGLPCGRGQNANVLQVMRGRDIGCNEFIFQRI